MCTLLLAVDVWDGARLVVAANRDELLARPASGPRIWERGGRRFFAPVDDVAGGSWIGVTEGGLFVGVTNRSIGGGPSLISKERRSRGALVLDALESASAAEAAERVRAWGAEAHNPFHLALVDERDALVVWSDGWTLHTDVLEPGRVHVVSERSYGAAESKRDDFLNGYFAGFDGGEPTVAQWRDLLSRRGEHDDDPRAAFDDVCVRVPEWGYGTRSSTWVRVDGAGAQRFAWIGRPPDQGEFEEMTAQIPWSSGG
ncbi:MAG: NRDE family protein [Deltaproteobacteria bacterium]|nr:NRDE family protein [Deltaproteobacteria bacterium]